MVRAGIVVRALLSRDVAPGFAGADRTGIKDSLVRHLRVCSCGMRYDVFVLPFHGLACTNGQGCGPKFEPADHNGSDLR